MDYGNKATDGGNLIISASEYDSITSAFPEAKAYIRRYYGAEDFISGSERYCLWVAKDEYEEADKIPPLHERFEKVRKFRSDSKAASTREYSVFPYRFRQVQGNPKASIIAIPRHSSERRQYLPIAVLGPESVISDAAFAIYDAPLWNFGLLVSRLHLVWIASVCGKLARIIHRRWSDGLAGVA
jgi:hypothetical protein